MGGRGSRSMGASPSASKSAMDRFKGGSSVGDSLDTALVTRANGSSVLGNAGDRVNRTYERNVSEIEKMDLSNADKSAAIAEQRRLASDALRTMVENPNPFATGRARVNRAKSIAGADKVSRSEAAIEGHMDAIRKKAKSNSKERSRKSSAQIIQQALADGKMSVVIDGKTYVRKSKRSKSFVLQGRWDR